MYEKNAFGDIIAVYTDAGVKQISYVYDAWGNFTTTYHNGATSSSIAAKNPYKYRGYYYDSEIGLYYLKTRYYDPNVGRFINADGYISTGQGLIGYNMYAYCNNNPIMYVDPNGESATAVAATTGLILGKCILIVAGFVGAVIVIGALIDATIDVVNAIQNIIEDSKDDADSKAEDDVITEPPNNGVIYYHVTTPENAAAIMSSGVMKGSDWEGGYVYAWKKIPNKYAIENSGAHNGVIISFRTNELFVKDTGITNSKVQIYGPVVSYTPGPISVWDVKIVG